MDWKTPTWFEVKMDAEIGSYQPDDDPAAIAQVEHELAANARSARDRALDVSP